MLRKGFSFSDIIIGIFLLGIIVVAIIPMINISYENLHYSREKTRMIYLAEYIVETLKSHKIPSYMIEEFEIKGESYFEEFDEEDAKLYACKIQLLEEHGNLWNIKIILSHKNSEVNLKDVELQACFPK